ncbi:MAG: hypothetical protein QM688_06790 [Sphingomonas bacterium]
MMLTLGRVLADVWTILRREGDLVLRVAGPFVFLPAFAVQLLAAPPPALPASPRDQAAMQAWVTQLSDWGQANAGWYLLADLIGIYGIAVLAILLIHPARPDVRTALAAAARHFGRFVLADIMVAVPVGLGLWLFVLPGLYMQARLVLTLPVLVADAPIGAARAFARSWALTRRQWWGVLAAIVTLFLAQYMLLAPLIGADDALRSAGHRNPLVMALVDGGMAAASTAYHLGILAIGIAVYRRLASSGI